VVARRFAGRGGFGALPSSSRTVSLISPPCFPLSLPKKFKICGWMQSPGDWRAKRQVCFGCGCRESWHKWARWSGLKFGIPVCSTYPCVSFVTWSVAKTILYCRKFSLPLFDSLIDLLSCLHRKLRDSGRIIINGILLIHGLGVWSPCWAVGCFFGL